MKTIRNFHDLVVLSLNQDLVGIIVPCDFELPNGRGKAVEARAGYREILLELDDGTILTYVTEIKDGRPSACLITID